MKLVISILAVILFCTKIIAQDMYLEYKMSGPMNANNKIYTSSTSGIRMEMEMNLPQVGKMTTVMLMPKGKNTMITYNMTSKTYTESSTDLKKTAAEDVKFVLVGKEKVGGYNCTHVKMTMANKMVTDMWTTKDIAGYQVMETLSKASDKVVSDKIYAQLKSQGADGIMVKTEMTIGQNKMVNQLVKAEKRTNPASLYVLPAGYTKMEAGKMPKGLPKR
jgi:glycerophosphoryl diester phosphodiesterase